MNRVTKERISDSDEVYKLEDFDVTKILKKAKKLAASYPDLPEGQHRLISLFLMAGERNAAKNC